ncbi:MAG: hypothetical protein RR557_09025 [Bacilli bacterium]
MCKISLFLAALFFLFTTNTKSEVIQYHPNSTAYIGGNFDPTKPGQFYPACLKQAQIRAESLLPGQLAGTPASTQFYLKKISSREELYRLLNVSLSASGSYGFFSGDFSGRLEQENTFSKEEFTWIIFGYSNFGKFILDSIELTNEAKLLKDNPKEFRQRCGTDFVGMEVRAVQAAAVFTIKNLAESERKVLEMSFNASYGGGSPININTKGAYSEFIKKASSFGQIEVNIYAMGGPGVSTLAPIITNIDKPDLILKTIEKYFDNLTLNQSVPISYNTGSLQSLVNNSEIETSVYNKFIADSFLTYENIESEKKRLSNFLAHRNDYNISDETFTKINAKIIKANNLQKIILDNALKCKNLFTNMDTRREDRRKNCIINSNFAYDFFDGELSDINPNPYFLRYYIVNELLPDMELINFSINSNKIQNVQTIKSYNKSTGTFVPMNSIKIIDQPDGSRLASSTIIMKDILDSELPIGLRIEMQSGSTYFEPIVFSRASTLSKDLFKTNSNVVNGNIIDPSKNFNISNFKNSYLKGEVIPMELKEAK